MTAIKLPVRKEHGPNGDEGGFDIWDNDNQYVCWTHDESHADAIVEAINGRERMRKAVAYIIESAQAENWFCYRGTDEQRNGFPELVAALRPEPTK